MRGRSGGLVLVVTIGIVWLANEGHTQTQRPGQKRESALTTEKVLMRDKLAHAQNALDGLAVADFGKIAKSAEMMHMISRASSWYVFDSDDYHRYSKNFQEQAADMERHAKDKNLDAAALDYVRMSLTCVECHKYVREVRARQKP
jgi:hypothetical protein